MSKLSDNIKAVILNKRAISNDYRYVNFRITTETPTTFKSIPYLQLVSFEAKFGNKYYIDEKLAHSNCSALQEVLTQIRKSVVEEVFGEFRGPLRELRHALYNRDFTSATEALDKLEDQMFNV